MPLKIFYAAISCCFAAALIFAAAMSDIRHGRAMPSPLLYHFTRCYAAYDFRHFA